MEKKTLIGLMAKARSGKSTAADYLEKEYGAHRLSIAKPIKRIVQKMYGFSDEQTWGDLKEVVDPRWGIPPREPMKDLGYWGREILGKDVWLQGAFEEMRQSSATLFVIDDIRYESEISAIESVDVWRSRVIKIHYLDRVTTDDGTHPSEAGIDLIPESRFSRVISHVKSPNASDLLTKIDGLMEALDIKRNV